MSEVEVLSHDEFWRRWGDPEWRAKRWSEAESRTDFCPTCCEAPCAQGCDIQVFEIRYQLDPETREWQRTVRGVA